MTTEALNIPLVGTERRTSLSAARTLRRPEG
jgi:hypothetical protein